jgi:hypothetical protein
VIAEVALALVLLVASGLMVRSFIKLRQVDVGFTEHNVLTLRVPLPEAKYPDQKPLMIRVTRWINFLRATA